MPTRVRQTAPHLHGCLPNKPLADNRLALDEVVWGHRLYLRLHWVVFRGKRCVGINVLTPHLETLLFAVRFYVCLYVCCFVGFFFLRQWYRLHTLVYPEWSLPNIALTVAQSNTSLELRCWCSDISDCKHKDPPWEQLSADHDNLISVPVSWLPCQRTSRTPPPLPPICTAARHKRRWPVIQRLMK